MKAPYSDKAKKVLNSKEGKKRIWTVRNAGTSSATDDKISVNGKTYVIRSKSAIRS